MHLVSPDPLHSQMNLPQRYPPGTHFCAANKKPAEAGFPKTIPTSCQKPSGPWSIVLDPAAVPLRQLMDPRLLPLPVHR